MVNRLFIFITPSITSSISPVLQNLSINQKQKTKNIIKLNTYKYFK